MLGTDSPGTRWKLLNLSPQIERDILGIFLRWISGYKVTIATREGRIYWDRRRNRHFWVTWVGLFLQEVKGDVYIIICYLQVLKLVK